MLIHGTTGADNLTGTSGNDTIIGGPPPSGAGDTGNDTLTGGSGSDQLYGLAGNDTLFAYGTGTAFTVEYLDGGDGDDIMWGDPDSQNIFIGGLGNDTVNGNWNSSPGATSKNWMSYAAAPGQVQTFTQSFGFSSQGADGADTVRGVSNIIGSAFGDILNGHGTEFGEIYGGGGNDLIASGGGIVSLSGDAGDDSLRGSSRADTLKGGAGDDALSGTGNSDTVHYDIMDGGDGIDTVFYDQAPSRIIAYLLFGEYDTGGQGLQRWIGVENFVGSTFNDILVGDNLANRLAGNPGDDALYGLMGDDTLVGGTGNDTLNGGPGTDTVSFETSQTGIVATINNTATGAGTDQLADFENITGSPLNDSLTGDSGGNVINGLAGYDTLIGGAGNDIYILDSIANIPPPIIIGGAADVSAFPPIFLQKGYDAVIEAAGGGTDTIRIAAVAGSGITIYTLQDTIENGVITGSLGFTLNGNALANALGGGGGNDLLSGRAGNDTFEGGAGSDTMVGGADNDTYFVQNNGDLVVEAANEGTDTVQSSIAHTLAANVERLFLTGSLTINGNGNELANLIVGNAANNVLRGLAGNDTLNGAQGNDTLDGGQGIDVIRLMKQNAGNDTAIGFSTTEDRFDLDGGQFTAVSEIQGDTILTHQGGTISVNNVTGLSLAQWNNRVNNPAAPASTLPEAAPAPTSTLAPHIAQDVFVAQFMHGREGLFERHFDSHHSDYLA